ncbi:MAG: flavodoxin family protein [Candidatus Thorarchaeota archaeon]|jgi:flavodoxin
MKALVTYFSQTGNTKLIAEQMHETLSTQLEVDIGTVRSIDVNALDQYDLLVVGAPCHDSDLAPPVKGLLKKLPDSPRFKLVGFFTHATNMPDSERNIQLYDQWAGRCIPTYESVCKDKNIEYLGTFHCQGKASEPIEHFIHQEIITEEEEWNQYLPDLRTHPTPSDVENAKKYALEILARL